MNSLSELNGFGATSLTVADDRPSKVIFDRVAPLGPVDQILTVASTTVSIGAGINIVEVVNYSTANVRYQIVITTSGSPLLTGSTVTWPSLPSGVVLTVVGSTYVLSGINSPAIWEQIKNFDWNLPAGYASSPLWYLDISIIYYDSALGQDVSVDYLAYDPIYYKVSEMEVTSSLSCVGQDARLVSASLICQAVLFFEPQVLEGIIDTISTNFTIVCNPQYKPRDVLSSNFSLSCSGIGLKSFVIANNSNFSVSCNLTALTKNIIPRSFVGQSENLLFATDTPFIDDPDPNTTATFTVTLTTDELGVWSTTSTSNDWPTSTYVISGTRSQVNNKLAQVRFFPVKSISRNGTYSFSLHKTGMASPYVQTQPMTYIAGTYTTKLVTITQNTTAWYTPTYMSIYSTSTDALLVGGGGAGHIAYGGGGGGAVVESFNISLDYNYPYNLYIGAGGTVPGGRDAFGGATNIGNGYRTYVGNPNPEFYPNEAAGGLMASNPTLDNAPTFAGGGNSGINFSGNSNNGGYWSFQSQGGWAGFSGSTISGGGGGGAGGSGQNGVSLTYLGASSNPSYGGAGGQGLLSTITGTYYGGGGAGGNASVNIIAQGGAGGGGTGAAAFWYNTAGQLQAIGQSTNPNNPSQTITGPLYFNSTPGTANTGGGGGGGVIGAVQGATGYQSPDRPASNGGTGVIVFRFNA